MQSIGPHTKFLFRCVFFYLCFLILIIVLLYTELLIYKIRKQRVSLKEVMVEKGLNDPRCAAQAICEFFSIILHILAIILRDSTNLVYILAQVQPSEVYNLGAQLTTMVNHPPFISFLFLTNFYWFLDDTDDIRKNCIG